MLCIQFGYLQFGYLQFLKLLLLACGFFVVNKQLFGEVIKTGLFLIDKASQMRTSVTIWRLNVVHINLVEYQFID